MPWGELQVVAQRVLAWSASEFWAATVYEMETALLARLSEVEPQPMSDAESAEFFDRMTDMGIASRA